MHRLPILRRANRRAAVPMALGLVALLSMSAVAADAATAYEQSGGNQSKTAQMLRLGRDKLRYRMKQYDLGKGEQD